MIKFRLFNITVTVSYIFLLPVCVLLLLDRTGYAALSLLTVALHEFAHFVAMRIVEVPIKQVDFSPCTVRVTTGPVITRRQTAAIALAGPLINLLLSLFVLTEIPLAVYFGAANLGFGLMNLIPAKGLDGGDLCYCVFSVLFKRKAEMLCNAVSIVFIALTVFAGGVLMLWSKYNPSLILVGIYLLILSFRKV